MFMLCIFVHTHSHNKNWYVKSGKNTYGPTLLCLEDVKNVLFGIT